jgi:hypothetical protein
MFHVSKYHLLRKPNPSLWGGRKVNGSDEKPETGMKGLKVHDMRAAYTEKAKSARYFPSAIALKHGRGMK